MAEAATCKAFFALTLTYDPERCVDAKGIDHSIEAVWTDFSLMVKVLRASGFPCQYLACYEAGKNRTKRNHVHAVLYFSEAVPDLQVQRDRWNWSYWKWGFTYVQNGHGKAVRYTTKMLKYILKEFANDPNKEQAKKPVWGMSSRSIEGGKDLIGADYFKQLAAHYVRQGLAPQWMVYTVPGCVLPDGSLWQFRLFGTCLRIFQETFDEIWLRERPGQRFPQSDRMTKGRIARILKKWRRPWAEYRAKCHQALLDGLDPDDIDPVTVASLGPRPYYDDGYMIDGDGVMTFVGVMKDERLLPRDWAAALPGQPYDISWPNSPEKIQARQRRIKHMPVDRHKPREDAPGVSVRRGRRNRNREPGELFLSVNRAREFA